MKSTARPHYFSAYPLKAIKGEVDLQLESAYLQSLLSKDTEETALVLPMVNPYTVEMRLQPCPQPKEDRSLTTRDWFNNYE